MNSHQRRVRRRREKRLQDAYLNGNNDVWARWMRTRYWKQFRRRLTRVLDNMKATARIPVMPLHFTFEIVDPEFARP